MTDPEVDLLVVGGGVLGTMTATLAVLDHPGWTVRLMERGRIGSGATGWSAGVSFPIARTEWQAGLVRASGTGYARLRELFPGLPVQDVDMLWLIDADRLPELAGRLVGGPPVPASDAQLVALRASYPDLVLRPGEVLVTTAERCFFAYAGAMVERLAAWLRSTGRGVVQEGVGVEKVRPGAGGWEARLTDGRALSSRRVVTAVGPWPTDGLLPDPVPAGRSRVKKVAALHVDHRPPAGAPCLVLWSDDAFVLPQPERGQCLLSYRNTTWDVDPAGPIALTPADVQDALAVLRSRSLTLAAAYAGGRAFCDAYTADLAPVLQHRAGFAAIGGCSGSGVRLAPGLAAAALHAVAPAGGLTCPEVN